MTVPPLRTGTIPRHTALVPAALAVLGGGAGAMLVPAGWPPGAALLVAVTVCGVLYGGTRSPWVLLGLVPALALPWAARPEVVVVAAAAAVLAACLLIRPPAVPSDPLDRLQERLARYPVLHQACFDLAACERRDQVVGVLITATRTILPRATAVTCFMQTGSGLRLAGHWAAPGARRSSELDAADRYTTHATRSLAIHEADGQVLRIPFSAGDVEVPPGLLRVVLPPDHENEDPPAALEVLARFGCMALGTIALLSEVRDQALRDELTGLIGRYEFGRRLHEQVAYARRHRTVLGLVFCDMDHLKEVNDRHGHAAGDALLRSVAGCIRAASPPGATCCRYGGEEFTVLLPDRAPEDVAAIAEAIVAGVRGHAEAPGVDGPTTISVGWGVLREGEDEDAFLARVDASCYRAKRAGRDRAETDA